MPKTATSRRIATYTAALTAFVITSCKKSEPPEEPVVEEEVVEEVAEPTTAADFPEMKVPEDNPQSPEKIALGHQLFFDERLSVDGSRSCYSCHQNEHGNGGGTPIAIGAMEKKLTRHSPVIWNVGYYDAFYWDGRSPSLEAQVKGAWGGGNMGVGAENLEKKTAELATIQGYKEQFDEVFPGEGMTPDTVAKAISAYERTLVCNDTAYDRFVRGDQNALTEEQKKGYELFSGKGQCTLCHAPPFFSNAMGVPNGLYYNIGIGTDGVSEEEIDVGRFKVTEQQQDWAAFKIPSLRNVSKSAPYFHDGSVATLEEAVTLMANGGIPNKNKAAILKNHGLTTDEIKAITAFLGALDCNQTLETPKLPQ